MGGRGPVWAKKLVHAGLVLTGFIRRDARVRGQAERWCSEHHYVQNRSTTELWKPQVFRIRMLPARIERATYSLLFRTGDARDFQQTTRETSAFVGTRPPPTYSHMYVMFSGSSCGSGAPVELSVQHAIVFVSESIFITEPSGIQHSP